MLNPNDRVQETRRQLRSSKVLTLDQLKTRLDCSQRSVQRYLDRCNCLSSFNHNGKYYTLPDIPDFNPLGIWRFHDIAFSRFGNLRETVIHVIEASPSGMTAAELGQVMGVNAHSFISQFRGDARLQREHRGGRWVYFSSKPETCEAQKRERSVRDPSGRPSFPSDAQAVIILVCLIKHPNATFDEIVARAQKEHSEIERGMVERLLDHHGIKKNGK